MKTFSKFLAIATLFCYLTIGLKAQEFDEQEFKIDTVYKKTIGREKTIGGVYFINRGKIISTTTPLKIGEFDTIYVKVFWKKRHVEKIVFDNINYVPTEKELQRGKYYFTITPSRTTTYKYVHYLKDGKKFELTRKLIIWDKNGVEIKEFDK